MAEQETDRPFAGRRALVVGGSGGIGAIVSRVVASLGATTVVHGGRDSNRLDAVIDSIRRAGGDARGILTLLDGTGSAGRLLREAGPVDVLAVAFGPLERAKMSATSDAMWRRVVTANLTLPGILVSRTLPHMISEGFGRILLFGGTGTDAVRGFTTMTAYAAAKTGVGVIAKSVARAHGGDGVCCNVLVPGFVDTEYLSDAQREEYRRISATGVLTAPEKYAPMIRILISADGGIPNGGVIDLSSGSFVR